MTPDLDKLKALLTEAERYMPALRRAEEAGLLGVGIATANGMAHAIENARPAISRVEQAEAREAALASALEGLVGLDSLGDLHMMRTSIKLVGAADDDRKAMLRAIDVLMARKVAGMSAEGSQ